MMHLILIYLKRHLSITDDLFVKKGNAWRFKGLTSLEKYKAGVISGYAYDDK
jgi:hypothetical protein